MDKRKKIVILGSAAVLLAMWKNLKIKKKKKITRRMWVRDIYLKAREQGFLDNLIGALRLSSPEHFFNFARMTAQSFEKLLSICGGYLVKCSRREAIRPEVRLMVTLRFLAIGDSYARLGSSFRIAPSTICNIIHSTCSIIWQVLSKMYLQIPSEAKWVKISKEFEQRWQLPNCVGSIDGKNVRVQAPSHSGSKSHKDNVVLLAISDAKYFFTYVNVDAYGDQRNEGILMGSGFGKALKDGNLNLPCGQVLPGTDLKVPLYFVGDEAFPLQTNLMRPYSKPRQVTQPEENIIFNYRLARARRSIENAFGIMASRFRIYHRREICADPETVGEIIKATVCLHNFIKHQKDSAFLYCCPTYADYRADDGSVVPGQWREEQSSSLTPFTGSSLRLGCRNYTKEAFNYRNYLSDYLNGIGSVSWQLDYVKKSH